MDYRPGTPGTTTSRLGYHDVTLGVPSEWTLLNVHIIKDKSQIFYSDLFLSVNIMNKSKLQMDSRTKQRTLSREEEVELSRSKKKVKDVHHADFNEGISENGFSPLSNNAWVSPSKSFKEKLIGEIPGACAQAFVFNDQIKDNVESDDEVTGLREGLAAVKLSKETKVRIRGLWSNALIVKLYGRKMGFTFINSKL